MPPQQYLLAQINAERESNGREALVSDVCLTNLAIARAEDMKKRGYFSHVTPDGWQPWDQMRGRGCWFHYAAENIAEAPSALLADTGFWNSPEHRSNILNRHFRKIGIGAAIRSDGMEIFVEEFTD